MGIGPYSAAELAFILLVNALPLPTAIACSRTPGQFVARWLIAMAAGFVIWLAGMLVVALTQFRGEC